MTTVHPERRLRVELPVYELTLDDVAELAAADEHGHRYELIDGNLRSPPRRGAAFPRVTCVKSSTNT